MGRGSNKNSVRVSTRKERRGANSIGQKGREMRERQVRAR